MSNDGDRLLTVPQVATRLQVSERQIRRFIKRDELRVLRIGSRVLIHPRDLADFLERCRSV